MRLGWGDRYGGETVGAGGEAAALATAQALAEATAATEQAAADVAQAVEDEAQAVAQQLYEAEQAAEDAAEEVGNVVGGGISDAAEDIGNTVGGWFSDRRLKQNIRKMRVASPIPGLSLYMWEWNEIAMSNYGLKGRDFGFISDEIDDQYISKDVYGYEFIRKDSPIYQALVKNKISIIIKSAMSSASFRLYAKRSDDYADAVRAFKASGSGGDQAVVAATRNNLADAMKSLDPAVLKAAYNSKPTTFMKNLEVFNKADQIKIAKKVDDATLSSKVTKMKSADDVGVRRPKEQQSMTQQRR